MSNSNPFSDGEMNGKKRKAIETLEAIGCSQEGKGKYRQEMGFYTERKKVQMYTLKEIMRR